MKNGWELSENNQEGTIVWLDRKETESFGEERKKMTNDVPSQLFKQLWWRFRSWPKIFKTTIKIKNKKTKQNKTQWDNDFLTTAIQIKKIKIKNWDNNSLETAIKMSRKLPVFNSVHSIILFLGCGLLATRIM